MENLLFNLDSVEVSYGDNVLTSVIQINERITDIERHFLPQETLNDFEKTQFVDRIDKLVNLNLKIQRELDEQINKLNGIKHNVWVS